MGTHDQHPSSELRFRDRGTARWYLIGQVVFPLSAIAGFIGAVMYRNMILTLLLWVPAAAAGFLLQFIIFFRTERPQEKSGNQVGSWFGAGSDKHMWIQAATMLGHDPAKVLALRKILAGAFFAAVAIAVIVFNLRE